MTANLLVGGDVVYLLAGGTWAGALEGALVVLTPEEGAAATACAEEAVSSQLVLDPYLFVVQMDGPKIIPASVREKIRAKGPTVRLDLGKQAA